MCEVIFMNYDKKSNATGIWKRGMAISAQDDGWAWNETEQSSAYLIRKFPKVPKDHADIQRLLEEDRETVIIDEQEVPKGPMLCRRKLKYKIDDETVADKEYYEDDKQTASSRLTRLYTHVEDLTK